MTTNMKPLYQIIAIAKNALISCRNSNQLSGWESRRESALAACTDELPHGSGFDTAPEIQDDENRECLTINGSYHKMDEYGSYDDWADFTITITAKLIGGIDVQIVCEDIELGDYIADVYYNALTHEVDYHAMLNDAA